MEVKSLTDSKDNPDGAFCPQRMAEANIDNVLLVRAITAAMQNFAPLLKNGHGVGVYVTGDDASVIGFTAPKETEE